MNKEYKKLKNYKHILFDLDGTLTDPKIGITKSVQYALQKKGFEVDDLDSLNCFIGPPLHESFAKYYSMSVDEAQQAVEYYRERFREIGIFENKVISGIPEVLTKLKNNNKRLYVATSKPTIFAKKILEHFELDGYFELIIGSELDGTRSNKKDVIRYIQEKQQVDDLKTMVMVGDREHDIFGAHAMKIDSIGVLFGYGSEQELKEAGATYIVDSPNELLQIFQGSDVLL